jgi:translation initiation factor IF-1
LNQVPASSFQLPVDFPVCKSGWKLIAGSWQLFCGTIIAVMSAFSTAVASAKAVGGRQKGRRVSLSKDDLIDMQGTVVAVHSGGLYRVQCDAGHEVLAQLSGRMRRFRIKVVPGDRVTVGVSPYDPVRGIITFRAR